MSWLRNESRVTDAPIATSAGSLPYGNPSGAGGPSWVHTRGPVAGAEYTWPPVLPPENTRTRSPSESYTVACHCSNHPPGEAGALVGCQGDTLSGSKLHIAESADE